MAMIKTTKVKVPFNRQQYELALAKSKNAKFIERYVVPIQRDLEILTSACPMFILETSESPEYKSQRVQMEQHLDKWKENVVNYLDNLPKLRESKYRISGEVKDFPYTGFLTSENEIRYLWRNLSLDFVISLRSLIDYYFESSVIERRTVNLDSTDPRRPYTGKSLKTKFLASNPKDLFSLQEVYPEPLPSMLLFPGENLSYLDLNPEFGNNCILADIFGLNYTAYFEKPLPLEVKIVTNLTDEYDRVIFHQRHCNIFFSDYDELVSPIEFVKKTIAKCQLGWQHLKMNGIFSLELESYSFAGEAYAITTKIIEAMNLLSDAMFLGCSGFSTSRNVHPIAAGVWSWQKSHIETKANLIEIKEDRIKISALGGIRSFIPNLTLLSPLNIVGISGFDSCPVALALMARNQSKTITLASLIETKFTVLARRLGACVNVFEDYSESDLKRYLENKKNNFSTSVYPFQLASRNYLFPLSLHIEPSRLWIIYATGFTYQLVRASYPDLTICAVNVNLINLPQINDKNLIVYTSPYPIEEKSLKFKLLEIYNTHKRLGDMYML